MISSLVCFLLIFQHLNTFNPFNERVSLTDCLPNETLSYLSSAEKTEESIYHYTFEAVPKDKKGYTFENLNPYEKSTISCRIL